MPQLSLHTPLGEVTISEDGGAIVALDWGRGRDQEATPLLRDACDQLQDYFDGKRMSFNLPLAPEGSDFQKRVWAALCAIPPGETRSYADIARTIGSAPRAVGGANGANPIPLSSPAIASSPPMGPWAAIPAAMDQLQSVICWTTKAARFSSPSTPDGYPHESRYPHP
jgi:methylated-DNA-[protein]-cysteine S-methyltransferase